MTNSRLVSVIIPTHNRPNFLRKTLQSILEQTYSNLEIFVISNGINEKNREIVDYFGDSRIVYREQENSGGPSSPRNHGICLAKGQYIAFCDDDDLWMPDKIEKQIYVLEKNFEYGLCYTKMLRFDEVKEWISPHEEGAADLQSLLYINTVPISSVVIRKSNVAQFGGFLESKIVGASEDYEFLLRHSTTTKFYFLDEYLIKYWSGGNRTTSLTLHQSITLIFLYTLTIFKCYYLLYRYKKCGIFYFLKPSIFHIKNLFKSLGYVFLFRIGLR